MDTLLNIKAFLATARAGSFSAAARQLGVAPSVVVKRINRLEDQMRAQLFVRSTRKLALTDIGERYFPRYQILVGEVEDAINGAAASPGRIEGHLRIKCPTTLTILNFGEIINDFQAAHPGISVEIVLIDRSVNPVEEDFDIAIGAMPASYANVIDEPLSPYPRVLCAAPSYLATRGEPKHPIDLIGHDCLTFQTTGSDANCAAVGQDVTCSGSSLATGADEKFTVHVKLASTVDSTVTLSNSASIASTGTADPNPANDSSNTVDTQVTEDVRLSVVEVFGSDSVTAGGASESFTVAVSNSGVSDADNVHVADLLDSRFLVDSIAGGGFDCSASSGQSVDCSLAHLGAGATKTVTVTYRVDSATDSARGVGNSASAGSDEDGPTGGEDSVDIVEDVRLSVVKSFSSASVTAGGASESFTVEVTNSGVSDADDVSLSDSVDGRLIVGTIDQGSFDCSASDGQSIDCSLDHLAANDTKSITVHYHVAATTDSDPTVENTAAADSDEADPTNGSDSIAIVEDVQLSVTKSFDSDTVTAGGVDRTFTVKVENSGASDADHVTLADTVPSRLIVDSVSDGDYSCPDGDSDAQTITCSLDHLGAGDTASILVNYHVDTTTEADAGLTNTATAASDEQSETSGNDTVAIVEDVNLVVTKQFADGAVDAGTTGHTFTLSVQNTGVSQADSLDVTDTVDARLLVTGVDDGHEESAYVVLLMKLFPEAQVNKAHEKKPATLELDVMIDGGADNIAAAIEGKKIGAKTIEIVECTRGRVVAKLQPH